MTDDKSMKIADKKMKIKAIAPYFGAKRTLAPRIVAELGPHKCYWEPFCGSMAVLLAKPACTMETVNDLHRDLINLARVIRDPVFGPMLYRKLRRTLMHEDVMATADKAIRKREKRDDFFSRDYKITALSCAYEFFVGSWLGRNGVVGTPRNSAGTYCVRYTRSGGHAAKRFRSAIASIPAWRRRMAHVTIINRDGFEVIERIGDDSSAQKTAIYVDPPYLVKGAKYLHDFDHADHERLAGLLQRFQNARVVVSYYDHPRLAELYPPDRWTKVHCPQTKSLVNAGMRDAKGVAKVAPEVLLINGPSRTGQSYTNPKEGEKLF